MRSHASAHFGIQTKAAERSREFGGVARRNEQAAIRRHDFHRARLGRCDDGKAGRQRLDDRDSEWLGSNVGLTVYVGCGANGGQVRLPAEKPQATEDAGPLGALPDALEIGLFGRSLRGADLPAYPPRNVAYARQSLEVNEMPLVWLPPSDLKNDETVFGRAELASQARTRGDPLRRIGLHGAVHHAVRNVGQKCRERLSGPVTVRDDQIGGRPARQVLEPATAAVPVVYPEDQRQPGVSNCRSEEAMNPHLMTDDRVVLAVAQQRRERLPRRDDGPGSTVTDAAKQMNRYAGPGELGRGLTGKAVGVLLLQLGRRVSMGRECQLTYFDAAKEVAGPDLENAHSVS
jgi:hypothetical protein